MAARITSASQGETINHGGRGAVITAAETNQLSTGRGRLGIVTVWGADAGTTCVITLYDHASSTTNPIFRWDTTQGRGTWVLATPFTLGLRAITSGTLPTSGGITVVWEGRDL